jgi:ribosome recycling factor
MIDEVMRNAEQRMSKTIEALRQEFSKIRTGRAYPSLLDHIRIEYYGSEVPLSQVATISILDPRTLGITPWDKNMVRVIEKAILSSDLGLNPATSGEVIRVPLPPLTEERRRDLTRVVRAEAENARVAIRNIRRDANHHLKTLVKNKEVAEDEGRRAEEKTQQLTSTYIAKIDELVAAKEKELMEI